MCSDMFNNIIAISKHLLYRLQSMCDPISKASPLEPACRQNELTVSFMKLSAHSRIKSNIVYGETIRGEYIGSRHRVVVQANRANSNRCSCFKFKFQSYHMALGFLPSFFLPFSFLLVDLKLDRFALFCCQRTISRHSRKRNKSSSFFPS